MKIVRESLNEVFSEAGDPIRDMHIGLNNEYIINAIKKEDEKHDLIQNDYTAGNIKEFVVTGAVGRNKQHLTGSLFKIIFWGNEMFKTLSNGKLKRMTFRHKAEYANQLIKDVGFEDLFSDYNWNPHDKGVVNFKIKPEFRSMFKSGHYK